MWFLLHLLRVTAAIRVFVFLPRHILASLEEDECGKLLLACGRHRHGAQVAELLQAASTCRVFVEVPGEHAPIGPVQDLADVFQVLVRHHFIVGVDVRDVVPVLVNVLLI